MSVEECADLRKRGFCYSVFFLIFTDSLPSFWTTDRTTDERGLQPRKRHRVIILKSADLLLSLLSIVYKGYHGFFCRIQSDMFI